MADKIFNFMLAESNSGTNEFITKQKTTIFGDRKLRSTILSTCRTYQLIFILILLYFKEYSGELNFEILEKAVNDSSLKNIATAINDPEKYVYDNFVNILHAIIALNNKTPEVRPVTNFDQIRGRGFNIGPLKIWPLCIYRFRDSLCITRGAIVHYFTIIEYETEYETDGNYSDVEAGETRAVLLPQNSPFNIRLSLDESRTNPNLYTGVQDGPD